MSAKGSGVKRKYELVAPDGGWGYMIAIAMTINFFTTTLFLGCFGLLFNDFLLEIGMASTSVTLLMGITTFCYAVSGLFTDSLLYYISMRKLAFIAAMCFNIGMIGNVFVHSIFMFFICQGVLQGIGIGILYNISCTMLNQYFVKKRLIVISFVQTIVAALAMVTPLFIKWSLEEYGYRGTLLLASGITLHNILAVTLLQPAAWHMKKLEVSDEKELQLLMKSVHDEPSTVPVVKLTDIEGNFTTSTKEKDLNCTSEPEKRKLLQSIIDVPLFKELIVSCVIWGPALGLYVDSMYMIILPQALFSEGWDQDYVALALSLYGFGDLALRIVFVIASKWIMKLGSQETYLIGIAVGLASRLGMLWSKSITMALVYITIIGMGHCCITILIPLVVADAVSPEKFTSAMGVWMMICGLSTLVFGPVVGAVRDLTNSYSTAFYILSSCFAIVILFWLIELCYKRNKHKREQRKEYLKSRANKVNKQ